MEHLKIIAKYRNGTKVMGTTRNFDPQRSSFHVVPLGGIHGQTQEVLIRDLKAMFVVRDFFGDPTREKHNTFESAGTEPYGTKLSVIFEDGEELQGVTLDLDHEARGFFLFPADPESNNRRVFVVRDAVREIRHLPDPVPEEG
jgi:hypothetical protein